MTVTLNVVRKDAEVFWDKDASDAPFVTVYAKGDDDEWHNTDEVKNDGKASLSYPGDFSGSSLVEVRAGDEVIDSGTITIS